MTGEEFARKQIEHVRRLSAQVTYLHGEEYQTYIIAKVATQMEQETCAACGCMRCKEIVRNRDR